MNDLHTAIMTAHAAHDSKALVQLYHQASNETEDVDEGCFFLTYAYIFALETGHPMSDELSAGLKVHNRL